MLDRTVMRAGAAAAMVGALILLVFNAAHPRGDEFNAAVIVDLAATESIWALDHYMLGWGILLGLFGLLAIARSFTTEPSISWARMGIVFAGVGAALGLATIGLDGFALKVAAQTAAYETALAVGFATEGLFVVFAATFMGAAPILYGAAVVTGHDYPVWLGWAVIAAGVVGLVAASLFYFEVTGGLFLALFLIASLGVTLWLGVTGYLLWQKLARTTPYQPAATAPPPTETAGP